MEFFIIRPVQPEHKTAIWLVKGEKFRKMGDSRWNQQAVTVGKFVYGITDVLFDISFQKKIKFAVIMVVRGNRAQLSIIIIKEFKIYRSHVLPFIEIHGNLFHVKMPSCTWNLSVLT